MPKAAIVLISMLTKCFARILGHCPRHSQSEEYASAMTCTKPHSNFPADTASATHFYNLLDYPAIVVPTPIKAQAKDRDGSMEYHDSEPWCDADTETKQLWKDYDYQGAPVCVQIVAKRHMENELMAAVGLMQSALQLP